MVCGVEKQLGLERKFLWEKPVMHTKRSDESHTLDHRRVCPTSARWLLLSLLVAAFATVDAHAQTTLTINGAGGVNPSGSDGLKTEIQIDEVGLSAVAVNEQSTMAGNGNWCCGPPPTARSVLLTVGERVVAASGLYQSVTLLASSGSASTSGPVSGSGSATLRYVAVLEGRTYQFDRRIDYTFPNGFVRETYTFTIPVGNTEPVRFYYGGDAAPGGSDVGYGIMLASPVRSIISLNPQSEVQLFLREVQGGRAFDGVSAARLGSGMFKAMSGEELGFVAEASEHDAELYIQWTLGSSPGTFVGAFEAGSGPQAVSVEAAFADETLAATEESALNISLVSTRLQPESDLGFTLQLPAGLVISGTATSNCGGTLTATEGSSEVSLAGAAVAGASNCLITIPLEASSGGTYTITSAAVTNVTGVANGVATSSIEFVAAPPGAPTNVVVTPSPETLSIAFTAPDPGDEPITSYEYSLNGGTSWNTTTATNSPIEVTGLTNGTTYLVAVRAVSAAGEGAASATVPGTPADVPAAPTSLEATAGDGTLSVSFVITDDGGSAVTDIEYALDGGAFVSSGTSTSPIVIDDLLNGSSYAVVLRAVNATGTSAESEVVTGTPVAAPAAPTLVAVTAGDRALFVSYALNSDNGSPVTDVEYSIDDGQTYSSAGLTNPFTIRGLTNDETYEVRIRAINAIGTSATSAMVPGTPVEPGTLLVKTSTEPAGPHCTHGGIKIEVGNDNDDSAALDDDEVLQTQYVCNGAPGQDGEDGEDGAPGQDGEDGEDGAPGRDGEDGEDGVPGQNGEDGEDGVPGRDGQDGADGADGEDGAPGRDGASSEDGKSALVTTRAATEEECATGGTSFESGVDDDGDGTLDADEVDSKASVCNGADGFVDDDTDGVDDRVELAGGTNCNSSGTEPSVVALAAALALVLRRRRRA
jgi:uncharacterized protein (TIGR03382 family)